MLKTRSGRNASQNEYELRSLIALMQQRGVRSYLEIGARHGDTFFEVMTSLPKGSFGLAMDLPGGLWGTEKSKNALKEAAAELKVMGYDVMVSLCDSTKPASVEMAGLYAPFDAILIDGDHLYEGVKADWLNYGPMGKMVAFHDIVGHDQAEKVYGNKVEVPRLWAEIKASGVETVEFVAPDSKMGIGVVLCK